MIQVLDYHQSFISVFEGYFLLFSPPEINQNNALCTFLPIIVQQKNLQVLTYRFFPYNALMKVELAGVEPASGQAITMPSTCLALLLIFEMYLRISTLIHPYLLNFAWVPKLNSNYPIFPAPLDQTTKGMPSEGCRASTSKVERGLKVYYNST